MKSVILDPSFAAWRTVARSLVTEGVAPEDVLWRESAASATVFGTIAPPCGPVDPNAPKPVKIAREFLAMLETAACYRARDRWPFLYKVLWRWTQGDRAVASPEDADGHRLNRMIEAVQVEESKMRKTLRFRHRDASLGPPEFISWCEPVHDLLEHAAMHFATRMGSATWMIATPHGAAFWDGALLRVDRTSEPEEKPMDFGESADSMSGEAVSGDAIEALWLAYYESTFAPALENAVEMASHMPVRYWKSPPNERADPALIARADPYTRRDREPRNVPDDMEVPLNTDLEPLKGTSLKAPPSLDACKRCSLWRNATQAVPGTGPDNARVMLVGEQPGDSEDREGTPFVGAAGKLLDDAIREAQLTRESLFLTNAVKHFKWDEQAQEAGGDKERLLVTPSQREREACRYWLDEELTRIAPKVVVALGATALKALTGHRTALSEYLGKTIEHKGRIVVPTYHPSYLLRLTDEKVREEVFGTIVEALVFAQQIADGTATVRTPVKDRTR
ncbi:UdgX family uracil-DNA binding protein [Caballeronia concitans]|uniref:Type-4 uracil-DNA glycosylase n=1 Tax=Caballeronia concitans TaxID=1777133 RepID=A0A658QVK6_9BURK|nr:UdgX family uracil-DNA binding protein [Caballeronia concitans]KIG03439.1 SPO1 DNA polymerase-related protein [Burkholderia sp. MR1]SAL25757.1 phage SPO1 DNA polymerase-related protein [Caballeronia concitans]